MKKMLIFLATVAVSAQSLAALTTQVQNDENENLVADSFGRTLYVFDPDQGQAAPQCNGGCAETWPPYLVSASESASLTGPLGSIARSGGKAQLTYNGRPVYTYAFDRGQGDDQGDGIGGVWHYIEIK